MKAVFVSDNVRITKDNLQEYLEKNVLYMEKVMWRKDLCFLSFALIGNGTIDKIEILNSNDEILPLIHNEAMDDKLITNPHFEICQRARFEVFTLENVQAFIGHAGWYAYNKKGILPWGPKTDVGDILKPYEQTGVENFKVFFLKIETDIITKKKCQNYKIKIFNSSNCLELNFKLTILSLTAPYPEDYNFKVEYWHHPYSTSDFYNVQPFDTEHIEILKNHQQFYKNLGGYGITASIVEEAWGGQTYHSQDVKYPSMIKWIRLKNKKFSFDFTDFDAWIRLNDEVGLSRKIICYSMMAWGSLIQYYDVAKNKIVRKKISPTFFARYKKYWKLFLNEFVHHLDDHDWFDRVYMGFDERSNMENVLDFLSEIKNKDGKSFKVSASFNNFIGNKECFDKLDYASVGLGEVKHDEDIFTMLTNQRRRNGKETTLYTATEHFPNSFALSLPCESYWTILYSYSVGCDGFLRWAFDAWVKNPLSDVTHCSFPAGDCFLIYPSYDIQKYKSPLWSLRLLKLDEAVRDVNKLILLSKKFPHLKVDIKNILSLLKNYPHTMLKNKSWGVSIMNAKWANEQTQNQMPKDISDIKELITKLFLKVEEIAKEGQNEIF